MTLQPNYSHAPHNDVSVNNGPHIRQWSHKIILKYNIIILTIVLQLPGVVGYTVLSRFVSVAYPGFFFSGGSTNSVEYRGQRERRSGGGSPLVRGSGGSCNLVQEISFHIVNFS